MTHEIILSETLLYAMKTYKRALLDVVDIAWERCDILGLEDQKELLYEIFEEVHGEILEDEEPPQDTHEESLQDMRVEGLEEHLEGPHEEGPLEEETLQEDVRRKCS